MQLAAFAFDYDGTLARNGRVAEATVDGLRRLKAAGQRLLLL
ncbi:MAG: haloacid dehalogenase, partial [Gammaproteobacteria bacterium]|nr:haloacid dehalogenase [Gammaproteobacteria bacterium]